MSLAQSGSSLRSTLITITVIVAFMAFGVTQLPKGFNDDLSRIGRGTATAVLIHNKNGVQSQNFMTVLNRVRSSYADRVEFLVADVDTDTGKGFLRTQQLDGVALVLFSPDGNRLRIVDASLDETELRRTLDNTYGIPR